LEAAQRLAAVVEQATEQVISATPQKRVADMIEKAAAYLPPGATAEQLNHITNCIQSFAREAADLLMRLDIQGLDRAIATFWYGVRDADKLAPPRPPLMPQDDTVFFFAGWSGEEKVGLRNILVKGLCGVVKGDRCISVDAAEAKLASGMRVSRKQARDAYVAPAGGKMIAVGSLPEMFALSIRGRS
jgi:hypothetical protein